MNVNVTQTEAAEYSLPPMVSPPKCRGERLQDAYVEYLINTLKEGHQGQISQQFLRDVQSYLNDPNFMFGTGLV